VVAAITRPEAVQRARFLNRVTIGWNAAEGVVALAAGIAAGSVSLVGFGADSVIEVAAALVLAWRLHQERKGGHMGDADRRATRIIAGCLAVLAAYVAVQAVADLVSGARPDASAVGVVVTALSLLAMPFLARAKARLAPSLGSAAVVADATQTRLCAELSAMVLVGVGLNASLGWWWADPLAALGVAAVAARESFRTWRAESLADTCCA
jgi:divalent metal cation (Fe/Co/Zn/Cd) transporter